MGSTVPESVRRHVDAVDACGACRLRVDRLRAELSVVRHVAAELPAEKGAPAAAVSADAARVSCPSWTDPSDESSDLREGEALFEPNGNEARPESVGRYRIVGELVRGGQASVYRAVHPKLPRDVAIKIAHKSRPIDDTLLRGDAELLCELDHPNLVRVHDLDVHEGRPFVVMEFVRGRNLQQVADQSLPSPHQAAAWIAEVAQALEYVNCRGVVHQDIKPSNIMLDESGRLRLIDFGMARWRHAWSSKRAGPSGGTLSYMAPEQARGESHRVGAPSDIFALGGVLYFLLTGKSPFGGGTCAEQWRRASQCDFDRSALRAKHVPRGLERIVHKAMAAQPENRYASAGDMANALDAFLHRPHRLALQAGALLLAALAVVSYCLLLEKSSGREPNPVILRKSTPESLPKPHKPDPAPSTQPLRIKSLQVVLYRRVPGDPIGPVGVDTFSGRLGQDARIQARLSRTAYCYLIALNPDGSTQPCYPKDPAIEPSSTPAIDYPSDPAKVFSLTDGVGVQAFVLVASTNPLPSFARWSKALGGLPWKPAQAQLVWRYDGLNFENERGADRRLDDENERGAERRLADLPQPLEATCRALRAGPGVEAIQVLAFPVKP
jgi:serine/threonine protein kinase